MEMISELLRRISSLGLWGSICILFSFFIASGNIVLSILILIAVLFFLAILYGPQFFAVFWLIGSPTIFGFPNQLLRPLPFVTMERLLLAALAAIVLLRMVFVKGRHLSLSSLELLILLFLSYALMSLVFHVEPGELNKSGWFFFQYAMPMMTFIISRRIEWSDRAVRRLLLILSMAGVFLAVVGIFQGVFGVEIFIINYQTISSGHIGRAHGTFSNAHAYSATLCVFLILTLCQFNMYRDSLVRFALIFAILLMAFGMFLGQTRAPWLGGGVALGIIFILDRKVRPLLVVGGVTAFFVGGGVFFLMTDLESIVNRITDLGTISGRLAVWATAVNMIVHNPIFGVGFGADSFLLNKPEYITGIGSISVQRAVYLGVPHNEYLHVAVLLGFTGLLLFMTILAKVFKLLFGIYRNSEYSHMNRQLSLYLGAIFVGLLINSLFSDTYMHDYYWTATYFFAGLVAGMPRKFAHAQHDN
mgnify:CR=1 FL=1